MLEIESKILEIKEDEVIEKLEKMNYKGKKEKKLISLLYDTKENSIVEKGGIVRLRFDGEKGYLTIKMPVRNDNNEIKSFEEEEKEINFNEMVEEFKQTHILVLKTEKIRKTYKFEKCVVEIDKYLDNMSFIPCFLEIEGENENVILEKAIELGFEKKDLKKYTTLDLIEIYST
jgi:adenylate cyclase class IV